MNMQKRFFGKWKAPTLLFVLVLCMLFAASCKDAQNLTPEVLPTEDMATPPPTEEAAPPEAEVAEEVAAVDVTAPRPAWDTDARMLDTVFIEVENPNQWGDKTDERIAKLTYEGEGQRFTCWIKIKPQGTSSLIYPKKNFTINMYADAECTQKLPMAMREHWGEQSKYCLKADWIDPTHATNVVAASLAAQMQAKYDLFSDAPNRGLIDGFPVVLRMNGEFYGIYNFNIPKDLWQFGMDKDNPDHIIMCLEGQDGSCLFTEPVVQSEWTIEGGPETDETWAKLDRVADFIRTADDETFRASAHEYLDIDACLNYYLFALYATGFDNTAKNMLLATYDGLVWSPSLYDLDSLWGVAWNGAYTIPNDLPIFGPESFRNSLLWEKLERVFHTELQERFSELQEDILNPPHIIRMHERYIMSIDRHWYDMQAERWTYEEEMVDRMAQLTGNIYARDAYVREWLGLQ